MDRPPVNIWNDIERCWVWRLDFVYEGKTLVGIHHSDMEDVVKEIDILCSKLQQYKSEMEYIYSDKPPTKNSMQATYLYLIKDNKTNFYKIGRSISPLFREKTLQSEKPDCEMIWISKITDKSNEIKIHKLFKQKRVRGEWFSLNIQDVDFIKENYDNILLEKEVYIG